MKSKQFKLRAFDSKKYFTVIVYDKLKDLRDAANGYSKLTGSIKDYGNTLGVCHPFERIKIKGKKPIKLNEIGMIRLSKKHTTTHIVFHETMHAAFWQYRLSLSKKYKENADFGDSNSDKEENFLHLAGKIYTKMIRQMYKHKYWK